MDAHLKTYATRLARRHVLKKVGNGLPVLETEEQLLEMASSRLREELHGMIERPGDEEIARMVRMEASVLVGRFTEDEKTREDAMADIAALTDDDILPKIH